MFLRFPSGCGFQRRSELLILNQEFADPLFQTPQAILPFFLSCLQFFTLRF